MEFAVQGLGRGSSRRAERGRAGGRLTSKSSRWRRPGGMGSLSGSIPRLKAPKGPPLTTAIPSPVSATVPAAVPAATIPVPVRAAVSAAVSAIASAAMTVAAAVDTCSGALCRGDALILTRASSMTGCAGSRTAVVDSWTLVSDTYREAGRMMF
eukprot:scaffold1744_cov129-Isochrysis_galbana.AAC.3